MCRNFNARLHCGWHKETRGPMMPPPSSAEDLQSWSQPLNSNPETMADVSYSDGFARQIVVGLSRFPELSVFMPNSSLGNSLRSDFVPAEAMPQVDFILAGNIAAAADVLKVKVTLLHAQSGRVIWAEALDSDVATQSVLDARDQIADRIVRTLMERITANSDVGEYLARQSHMFRKLDPFQSLSTFTEARSVSHCA